MGQFTNACEANVLNHMLKITSAPGYTPPGNVYIGLSKTDPTADGSGWSEADYTGYARVACSFGAANVRRVTQGAQITFPQSTGNTVTLNYWGVWNRLSGGTSTVDLMAYGSLASSKTIYAGNQPIIAPSQVYIEFSAGVFFTSFANTLLNWLFRNTAWGGSFAQPTSVNIGLSTSLPTDAGAYTEPTGGGYVRKGYNNWNPASGNPRTCTNFGTITMATATGDWGTVGWTVLFLDSTPAYYATIPAQTVGIGDTVRWLNNGDYEIGLQ